MKKDIIMEIPAGVRDYRSNEMMCRNYMLETIRNIFELYNVIIGEDEIKQNRIKVRNTNTREEIFIDDLVTYINKS